MGAYSSQHLLKLPSTTDPQFTNVNVLGITYVTCHTKLPNASFHPFRMPAPTRKNNLTFQPGTRLSFPSLLVEISITNESWERLPMDAADKYFNIQTSVSSWIGVKLDMASNMFWCGWGQRTLAAYGINFREQTEDAYGIATFLPVYPCPLIPLAVPAQHTVRFGLPPPRCPREPSSNHCHHIWRDSASVRTRVARVEVMWYILMLKTFKYLWFSLFLSLFFLYSLVCIEWYGLDFVELEIQFLYGHAFVKEFIIYRMFQRALWKILFCLNIWRGNCNE
jgi:hypothetical protein